MTTTQSETVYGAKTNGTIKMNGAAKGGVKENKTDHTRWRLQNDRGCHIWHYLGSEEEAKKWPQSTAEKWYLGMDTVSTTDVSHSVLALYVYMDQ
jgi:lanosterol synthase